MADCRVQLSCFKRCGRFTARCRVMLTPVTTNVPSGFIMMMVRVIVHSLFNTGQPKVPGSSDLRDLRSIAYHTVACVRHPARIALDQRAGKSNVQKPSLPLRPKRPQQNPRHHLHCGVRFRSIPHRGYNSDHSQRLPPSLLSPLRSDTL
jgi:hypothetical protein